MGTGIKNRASDVARWCAIALGFSIPISVALDKILILILLLAWLSSGRVVQKFQQLRAHPVARASLVFAAVMLAGMAWSPQSLAGLRSAMVEVLQFAMLGVLMTVFQDERTRAYASAAFLSSSTLVLLLSFLLWSGLMPPLTGIKGTADYLVVFKYHITQSVLMAVAAVMFLVRALESLGLWRWLHAALAGTAAFHVFFMIPGRTGQLALAAACVYLACSRYRVRGLLAVVTGLTAVIVATWWMSGSVMHQRVAIAIQEASAWQPDKPQPADSSVGLRLEFYRNTLHMIADRPWSGIGTGGFRIGYAEQVAGTRMAVTDNPHNGFLLIGAELGLFGLSAFALLIFIQWRTARQLPSISERTAARGLLVIFLVASLVSSTFNDHAEGLFFVWASALLWSGLSTSKPS